MGEARPAKPAAGPGDAPLLHQAAPAAPPGMSIEGQQGILPAEMLLLRTLWAEGRVLWERFWFGLEVYWYFFHPLLFFKIISSLFLNTDEKKSLSASVITRLRITSKKCQFIPKAKCSLVGL